MKIFGFYNKLNTIDGSIVKNMYKFTRRVTAVDCRLILEGDEEEIRKAESLERVSQLVSDENLTEIANNCTEFVTRYGYITDPLSKEEEDFPIAYSILTYKDANQTERLLRSIYRPQNVCLYEYVVLSLW